MLFLKAGIKEINPHTIIEVVDEIEQNKIGTYNEEENTISLNYGHPLFRFPFGTRPSEYKVTIRQALIDRFGDKGTRKDPGKLYGFKHDMWQALAISTYVLETNLHQCLETKF